tara:strand:- start:238 stop:1413 length:1176 start_codon:yes stop_codon:yes gene_type:complete
MNKKNIINDVYLIGGIAVDIAQISIGCLESEYNNSLNIGIDYTEKNDPNWHTRSFSQENKNNYDGLTYYNGCDGLYTSSVGVDIHNQVHKIFIEAQISEYINVQKNKLICERSRSGTVYKSFPFHRLTYNDQFFGKVDPIEEDALIHNKIVNPARIKLFDLKVKSGFILVSDQPPLWTSEFVEEDRTDEETSMILKEIRQKYKNKKMIPIDMSQAFPVDNGTYPVYAYCYTQEEDEFNSDFVKIVVENIKGCHLNKNEIGDMVFERNRSTSQMVERCQKKQYKKVALDKIDLRDSTKLEEIARLEDVQHLTLRNINDGMNLLHSSKISWDVSPLLKLNKLKKLTLDHCDRSLHLSLAEARLIKPKIDRYGQYKIRKYGHCKTTYNVESNSS